MPRLRRRTSRSRFGDHLTPMERFDLTSGHAGGFGSEAERQEAWEASRDTLLRDARTIPEAWWRYDSDAPAELREHVVGYVGTPEDRLEPPADADATTRGYYAAKRAKLEQRQAREAWLAAHPDRRP
jgi:hypothetical protein